MPSATLRDKDGPLKGAISALKALQMVNKQRDKEVAGRKTREQYPICEGSLICPFLSCWPQRCHIEWVTTGNEERPWVQYTPMGISR